jgi:hypothetical protein
MAETLLTYTTTLSKLTCGACHIPFAIPRDLHERLRNTGDKFWCPNGHGISYAETENDRLRVKAEREERWRREAQAQVTHERDQRQAAERSASAYRGRVTRLKNRAAAGICPCCTRHFENVQRHMESKHPGFTESAEPADA